MLFAKGVGLSLRTLIALGIVAVPGVLGAESDRFAWGTAVQGLQAGLATEITPARWKSPRHCGDCPELPLVDGGAPDAPGKRKAHCEVCGQPTYELSGRYKLCEGCARQGRRCVACGKARPQGPLTTGDRLVLEVLLQNLSDKAVTLYPPPGWPGRIRFLPAGVVPYLPGPAVMPTKAGVLAAGAVHRYRFDLADWTFPKDMSGPRDKQNPMAWLVAALGPGRQQVTVLFKFHEFHPTPMNVEVPAGLWVGELATGTAEIEIQAPKADP